ncbi:serine/threonine protein kinase [Arthrobacter agilis]|uniref:protein kinase domain-containing protein n=1 Tax=Arthrobacter agilis TaxID=37921 RepID=UPI000F7E10B6|nr:serine/threonine-protein kinase [Arthrobacter agilis]TPV23449.1 serine/threonine protein kinase [Arthrobacter agilis]
MPVPPAPAGSVAGSAHPSGSEAEDMALEMRLLRRFDHEHLLRIHRTVATDRGPALLLEFAAGGSLLGLLTARGPLPIAEVVTALVPIAQALDYLHGSGAVHGDVSPANILFTQEGKPLLADFGTGRLLGTPDRAAPGTPGFVDPARGAAYDPGADVFALAAVAWFALTGRIPGPEQQRPPLVLIVPDVPPPLVQLIEDGLSADRRHRPGADDFARVLLASAAADPVDLVPAVHASVRPELLTRRSGSPRAPSKPAWQRLRLQRWGPDRSRPAPSARSSGSGRGSSTVGRDDTTWRRLALLSGTLALLLLSAGIALTMGGVSGPADPDRLSAGSSSSSTSANSSSPAPASSPRPVVGATGRAGPGAAQTGGAGESASRGGGGAEALDAGSGGGGPGEPGTDDGPGDPTRALVGLAALRAAAFATPDAEILRRVDVAGSPAMTADQDAVEALATSDRHLPDLTIAIRDAALLEPAEQAALPVLPGVPYADAAPADTDVALVRATAALSAYTEESTDRASGLPPPALMAASRQDLVFVLWNDGTSTDGWLIHSVIEAPD